MIPDPKTHEEYLAKFNRNQKIFGFGFGTSISLPCPFCAEPDFMKYKIVESEQVMAREHVCSNCGRGCKAIFTSSQGEIKFEFVQTGGSDVPEYLPPMKRVS